MHEVKTLVKLTFIVGFIFCYKNGQGSNEAIENWNKDSVESVGWQNEYKFKWANSIVRYRWIILTYIYVKQFTGVGYYLGVYVGTVVHYSGHKIGAIISLGNFVLNRAISTNYIGNILSMRKSLSAIDNNIIPFKLQVVFYQKERV